LTKRKYYYILLIEFRRMRMAECKTRQTLNELLVDLFNFILYIQEKYMKEKGVPLTMYEVHLLENVSKIENNTIGNIADAMLVTKGTLSVNASRLIKKGYLTKYVDKEDRRVVRVEITDKARDILKIHDEFHENLIDRALEDLNLSDNEVLNKSFESILTYFKTEYRKMSQKIEEPKVKDTQIKKIKKLNMKRKLKYTV
jgi:Transcriptional regulators